jgi:hypothetical protein
MDGWSPTVEVVEEEICSLAEAFDEARDADGMLWWNIIKTCLMDVPRICLNPMNWINGCSDDETTTS